jgi:hypothetical protein
MHDRSVVKVHLSIDLESAGPDLSQPLGEVCSLLNHWFKIATVVDAELAANNAKRVAARRDERQLITVMSPSA